MLFQDLREYIHKVEEIGEYRLIEGANVEEEIGAITHLVSEMPNSPLLMFDKIKGYPPGFRVASNLFTTHRRTALALGFPLETKGIDLVRAFRDKNEKLSLIPPVEVKSGPVMENVLTGDKVDLLKLPSPKWHELDGGPYIGTGSMIVMRDPEDNWVNVGCYRVQVHGKNRATIHIVPSHQGDIIQKMWWKKGKACPAVVTCGQDPISWLGACWPAPWGISEYDFVGGWNGKPLEVVKGITTGLPFPATSELALEGELVPPEVETIPEGPFGEWPGYYATGKVSRAAFRVQAVMHRNDPINQGNPPHRLPAVWSIGRHIQRAATVWSELDRQIPGVKGVWMVEDGTACCMMVISLKQEYPGHAKQAALTAAGTQMAAQALHYIIVVDDDIDPSNIGQVIWALATRADPQDSINIITGHLSSFLDPSIPPEKRKRGDSTTSLAIILAVRPYHWKDQYPPAIEVSPEVAKKMKTKWSKLFASL
ncbi:MAG: UbiD family decarboxylase [Chloroflexota bacterium]